MAYHMRDEKLSVAMREAMKLNIVNVDFNDKQEIIKFFTGQTSETNKIDTAIRAQTLIKKADIKQGKVLHAQQNRKREQKAERKFAEQETKVLGEKKELTVADYIQMNEKSIHGRATVLQSRKKNFLKVLMLGYQMVRQTAQADAM